ncbi:MAG TPA: 16S rRNA (guanine(966)-N(2))-methyltransferase RsmD [Candidatus Saccharimonadales bacterium]|jgi:16S rRNA (guanine966-N2)-methyltransferase|nr:16S rRNA (guanine(966)-N(2))-methyltransferase RsmD [Candidatus Saccharimonadales bacterium]
MRVIAGKFRSRRLVAPAGTGTRPTSDRLRETLFNVIGDPVQGSVWLDLFAGTGAIGIEALSRGARMIYFVESSKRAARTLRENLHALGIKSGFEVVEREAASGLRQLNAQAVGCDFCYLDPPYRKMGDYSQTLSFLAESKLIAPGGLVIAEHDKHFDPGETFGSLQRRRKLQQGDAVLSFYGLETAGFHVDAAPENDK